METVIDKKIKTVFPEYLLLLGLSIAFFETFASGNYHGGLTWLMISIITATFLIKRGMQKYYTKKNWKRHILIPLILFGVLDGVILFSMLQSVSM